MLQKTINKRVEWLGKGLHTGNSCKLTLTPGKINESIQFHRDNDYFPVSLDAVFDTTRSTNLLFGDYVVYTIEHLLSALAAMQITSVIIEVEGNEIPILDGSAHLFVKEIVKAGVKEFSEPYPFYATSTIIEWHDIETGAEYILLPHAGFEITCLIDYNSKTLGKQYATLSGWKEYLTEVAPAKTFCFLHEIEYLYHSGLIKGGDLTNALVYSEKPIEQEKAKWLSNTFHQPVFSIPERGVLNPLYQTFDNEAARHKILDLIGDLRLLPKAIQGNLIVSKPGHTSNIRFARFLLENFMNNN